MAELTPTAHLQDAHPAEEWLFLAMAYQRLGRLAEVRHCLTQAARPDRPAADEPDSAAAVLIAAFSAGGRPPAPEAPAWQRKAELTQLRREAEALGGR